ncbi:hypothetical protein D9M71_128470 [compost metagenome]
MAGNQGEILEVGGSNLATLECHRQQATVVAHHHWQLGLQGAIAKFGVRYLGLGGQPQAAEFIHRRAVAVQWEDCTGRALHTWLTCLAATVQAHAEQAQRIHAEPDRPLGEARGVVEDKTLAPFFLLARGSGAIAVIGVDVEVTQGQVGLAVFDKALRAGLLGDCGQGNCQVQRVLFHCSTPWCFLWLSWLWVPIFCDLVHRYIVKYIANGVSWPYHGVIRPAAEMADDAHPSRS